MLLQIKNLKIAYEKAIAIKDISICVDEGEIVTIIGCNGAGKSTLLQAISGLLKPVAGQIIFDGKDICKMSPQQIVTMGIAHAPEGRRVFRDLSVYENLLLGAYTRKDKKIKEDIERIYTYFPRLKERWKQRAGSLSGGEQQMLTIARALLSKPRLLLLDEPSMGLAPFLTIEISRIINEINNKEKLSIILVEQNSQLALRISKRGYLVETGSIVLEGTSQELVANDYVKKAYLGI